jgi:5-formyltetrahydrofolate cyclo-ligase
VAFPSPAPEPAPSPAAAAKHALRRELHARLRQSTADPAAVRSQLDAWLRSSPAIRTVASFAAMAGEVDLLPLLSCHTHLRWVFPRVQDSEIILHEVAHPPAGLQAGTFGILEPDPSLPVVPPDQVDLFFCPGLGFDPQGGRLGRGKGFYDRLLAAARPDALKIGVCFACQQVETTFPEPHDIPMDRVFCEDENVFPPRP